MKLPNTSPRTIKIAVPVSFYDISGPVDKVISFIKDRKIELAAEHPTNTGIELIVEAEQEHFAYEDSPSTVELARFEISRLETSEEVNTRLEENRVREEQMIDQYRQQVEKLQTRIAEREKWLDLKKP